MEIMEMESGERGHLCYRRTSEEVVGIDNNSQEGSVSLSLSNFEKRLLFYFLIERMTPS